MNHPETRTLIPGANYSVLFLHGIAGTPNHFRNLLPLEQAVPSHWSVINVRYPGHGGDVRDFGRSSMELWRKYAREAFLELAKAHKKILIVGHSMGTLFAIQLALEFPEKVAGLFLVAVPLRPWVRFSTAVNCLRLAFGCIRQTKPMEAAFEKACGIEPTPLVWRYIRWIPRAFELFEEICRTEKVMGNLTVPSVAWQSRQDDLVANRSASLLRRCGVMAVYELKNSSHFYYEPEDLKHLTDDFHNRILALFPNV